MSTKGKRELELDSLDNITGGTEQNNSNNDGAQQNNESGDNISDVIQENNISNNRTGDIGTHGMGLRSKRASCPGTGC